MQRLFRQLRSYGSETLPSVWEERKWKHLNWRENGRKEIFEFLLLSHFFFLFFAFIFYSTKQKNVSLSVFSLLSPLYFLSPTLWLGLSLLSFFLWLEIFLLFFFFCFLFDWKFPSLFFASEGKDWHSHPGSRFMVSQDLGSRLVEWLGMVHVRVWFGSRIKGMPHIISMTQMQKRWWWRWWWKWWYSWRWSY